MIITMEQKAKTSQIRGVVRRIESLGLSSQINEGTERKVIAVLGDTKAIIAEQFSTLAGVERVVRISKPYKLASSEIRPGTTLIDVSSKVQVGGKRIHVIAGPCAVENGEMLLEIAENVKKAGATMLRGGAFKPRTSPYSFQGMGEEGLKLLSLTSKKTGLPVVSEVRDLRSVDLVAKYADVLQVGARNMQNYDLLIELGKINKPVLIKRGLSATIDELLQAAEYILKGGNKDVMLCERGIRTYETSTRNTLDISAVPVLKSLSHLPVIVDPSHAAGYWSIVPPLSNAAIAAGADGLLIEVHNKPENAISDGSQSLKFNKFDILLRDVKRIAKAVGREI